MSKQPQPFEPLYPLVTQSEYLLLETELKEAFIEVFHSAFGEKLNQLSCYGSPHLIDDIALLKRFFLKEGLVLPKADIPLSSLKYLLKAWRSENQKRGLHFLRTYLQLIYPNKHNINQLWQDSAKSYPNGLATEDEAKEIGSPHWLTSRVSIEVTDEKETGVILDSYRDTLQKVVGARFLLELYLFRELYSSPMEVGFAAGSSATQFVNMNVTLMKLN